MYMTPCCDISSIGSTSHVGSGGGGTTVVNKRKKRPRLGKERLVEMDQTNLLLDQWKASDVQQLLRIFKKSVGLTRQQQQQQQQQQKQQKKNQTKKQVVDNSHKLMNREAFFQVFAELQSLPSSVADAAFNLFDRGRTGSIDFREFCTAIAICCLASKKEQVTFVFDLFDGNSDGMLTVEEVRLLLRTAVASMAKLSSHQRSSESSSSSQKSQKAQLSQSQKEKDAQQWIAKAEQELLGFGAAEAGNGAASSGGGNSNSSNSSSSMMATVVTREQFLDWANLHLEELDVSVLLETFRVFPSKEGQYRAAIKLLNEWEGLKEGDSVYVVSMQWWEEWYVTSFF
jgi:Ca2+-binding EF-hand superfamily protein